MKTGRVCPLIGRETDGTYLGAVSASCLTRLGLARLLPLTLPDQEKPKRGPGKVTMDQERALMKTRTTSRDIPGQLLPCSVSVYLCSALFDAPCDFAQQTRGHNPLWHRALYLHCSLPTAHPPVSQLISQSVSQSLSIRALPTPRPRHTTIYSRHALALGIPQCC